MAHRTADTPQVCIRKGADRFGLIEQVRITPAPKLCGKSGPYIRCLSRRQSGSVIQDVEPASHLVDRKVMHDHGMQRIWFHAFPFGLGYRQQRRLGNRSELFFLDPEGALARRVDLPDAVSQVLPGCGPFWYVACRNGALYQFSSDGVKLWEWGMPPGRRHGMTPVVGSFPREAAHPYLNIAASSDRVVAGEGENFYVLTSYGEKQWGARIPQTSPRQMPVPPSTEVPTRQSLPQKLGIEGPADSVRAGYVRLALARDDARSRPQWMTQVASCTEALTADRTGDGPVRVEFEIGDEGFGETITAVAASEEFIFAGSSGGRLYAFDGGGDLRKAFQVGHAPVSTVLLGPNGLCWTYSGGRLTVFLGTQIAGAVQLPDYFMDMVSLAEEVLVWNGRGCWVIGNEGDVKWRAEFARPIRSAVADELGFWILAGPLYGFRKS